MIVQLAEKNPILLPKSGNALRIKVQAPYLVNADALFVKINWSAFAIEVDGKEYGCVLNQDLSAPFKIIPWDNPLIELCLEVYCDSVDTFYLGKNFSLKLS